MDSYLSDARVTIVCGHYGTGKTNLAINLALMSAAAGRDTSLLDLDVVNPYFRSSDSAALLAERGVIVHGPNLANTNLDTPSLSAAIGPTLRSRRWVIVDLGGDDVGATAFARFAGDLPPGYSMLYVVNRNRPEVSMPEGAVAMLREIESKSGARATGIANNTHLMGLTTPETVAESVDYAESVARLAGLPLLFTTVPRDLSKHFVGAPGILPIDVHVRVPWG
ncbi:MAG: ParA family protein [Thermoplasmatales archaeon]|nr:ParA family protein [Thermoplasmatales archaeon]